jgi:hypothetical protein
MVAFALGTGGERGRRKGLAHEGKFSVFFLFFSFIPGLCNANNSHITDASGSCTRSTARYRRRCWRFFGGDDDVGMDIVAKQMMLLMPLALV